jgi:hypothetical protein
LIKIIHVIDADYEKRDRLRATGAAIICQFRAMSMAVARSFVRLGQPLRGQRYRCDGVLFKNTLSQGSFNRRG